MPYSAALLKSRRFSERASNADDDRVKNILIHRTAEWATIEEVDIKTHDLFAVDDAIFPGSALSLSQENASIARSPRTEEGNDNHLVYVGVVVPCVV